MTDTVRVLVTGGAGFIGSHITERFSHENYEVCVFDDLSSGFEKNIPQGVRLVKGSIESPEAVTFIKEFKPNILVHAAAQISVRVSMDEPLLDAEANVKGLLNILTALSSIDYEEAPRVVFLSTGGAIYGETEDIPTVENAPTLPTSLYGLHKRFGELYLDFWAREHGIKATALRLANVYGPRQNPHGEAGVVAIFSERLLKGDECIIFGDGKQTRDFVYVHDVVEAVYAVCKEELSGIYNVGTGEETSVKQLFDTMKDVSKSKSVLSFHPAKVGEQMRSAISPRQLMDESQWQCRFPLSEGIEATIGWFRESKKDI